MAKIKDPNAGVSGGYYELEDGTAVDAFGNARAKLSDSAFESEVATQRGVTVKAASATKAAAEKTAAAQPPASAHPGVVVVAAVKATRSRTKKK